MEQNKLSKEQEQLLADLTHALELMEKVGPKTLFGFMWKHVRSKYGGACYYNKVSKSLEFDKYPLDSIMASAVDNVLRCRLMISFVSSNELTSKRVEKTIYTKGAFPSPPEFNVHKKFLEARIYMLKNPEKFYNCKEV